MTVHYYTCHPLSKMSDMSANPIHHIETLAFSAWPAREVEPLHGWQLRASDGATSRANSVWPNAPLGNASLDVTIEQVEQFYRARNLPSQFQLSPAAQPADLDAALAARGYGRHSPTLVQIAPLNAILRATPGLYGQSDFALEVAEGWDDDSERDWFAIYREVGGYDERAAGERRAVIQRLSEQPQQPLALATLRLNEEPVAVGLGVVEDEWVGIFCMATLPVARRRGAGTALLRTLAIWAAQMRGATRAYLQVEAENQAAQALYARVGFETLYAYHYRIQG